MEGGNDANDENCGKCGIRAVFFGRKIASFEDWSREMKNIIKGAIVRYERDTFLSGYGEDEINL